MVYYYDKNKAMEGKLFVTRISDKLDMDMPKNEVYYVVPDDTGDLFTGYPIVKGETIRPATDAELVELGILVLGDDQEISGTSIVNKRPDLEGIKKNCIETLEKYQDEVEREDIVIDGIIWYGGYDSAQKLDAARRLAIESGQESVKFTDTSRKEHTVTLDEAKKIILSIGGAYKACESEYNVLITSINSAQNENDVYLVLEGNAKHDGSKTKMREAIQNFLLTLK